MLQTLARLCVAMVQYELLPDSINYVVHESEICVAFGSPETRYADIGVYDDCVVTVTFMERNKPSWSAEMGCDDDSLSAAVQAVADFMTGGKRWRLGPKTTTPPTPGQPL